MKYELLVAKDPLQLYVAGDPSIYTVQTLQVVQEYERAVIFRLGRLRLGGAKVREGLEQPCKLFSPRDRDSSS